MRQIRRFLFSFLIILIFSILNCGAGIIVDILKNQILFLPYLGFYTKPTDYYLTQQLDHFELTNDTTWKQRYWKISTYYENQGPVFLWINGEAPLSSTWTYRGQIIKYAKEFKAYCFFLEHRFYGKSNPTRDVEVNNLQYLKSAQALADIASFISITKRENSFLAKAKWIIFGGSYGGTLAAWFQMKYPDLVNGVVLSGAPLFAQIDFHDYYSVVNDSIASFNEQCTLEITKASKQLYDLSKTEGGCQIINDMFRLCKDLGDTNNEKVFLFKSLAENIASVVEYSKDYKISTSSKHLSIQDICRIMMNDESPLFWKKMSNKSPVYRYAKVNELILKKSGKQCFDVSYKDYVTRMQKTDLQLMANERIWLYQRCAEFGFYQTSKAEEEIFDDGLSVDFFNKLCVDIFGSNLHLNNTVQEINDLYGDTNNDVIDNILYIYGSLDPWKSLGIYKSVTKEKRTIVTIKGSGHCSDLYSASWFDNNELKNARKEIRNNISKWLYGYNNKLNRI